VILTFTAFAAVARDQLDFPEQHPNLNKLDNGPSFFEVAKEM
jgi:hypothetical protein